MRAWLASIRYFSCTGRLSLSSTARLDAFSARSSCPRSEYVSPNFEKARAKLVSSVVAASNCLRASILLPCRANCKPLSNARNASIDVVEGLCTCAFSSFKISGFAASRSRMSLANLSTDPSNSFSLATSVFSSILESCARSRIVVSIRI